MGGGLIIGEATDGLTYGVRVDTDGRLVTTSLFTEIAKGNVGDAAGVNKFGFNGTVGATPYEEIWDGEAAYEYLADDTFATMYLSSDDETNDVGLTYSIQGIDSEYNLSTVIGTLHAVDARTMVALTSGATDDKWWRIFRVVATSSTASTGNIYVSKDNTDAGGDGIPDTATDIQAKILVGNEQTLMALWTCPVANTAYLTGYYAATSVAKVTTVKLFVRPFGGVFNLKHMIVLNATKGDHDFKFPLTVAAKSDLAMTAIAAGGGGAVAAGFDLWYEAD
jgi:hypothetical protein